MKAPEDLGPGEGPLPGLQISVLHSHMAKNRKRGRDEEKGREREAASETSSSYTNRNLIMGLHAHDLT